MEEDLTPRKVIQQLISISTPLPSTIPSPPFAFTPAQPQILESRRHHLEQHL